MSGDRFGVVVGCPVKLRSVPKPEDWVSCYELSCWGVEMSLGFQIGLGLARFRGLRTADILTRDLPVAGNKRAVFRFVAGSKELLLFWVGSISDG